MKVKPAQCCPNSPFCHGKICLHLPLHCGFVFRLCRTLFSETNIPNYKASNLHSARDELLLIFYNKAAKTFKRGSWTCSQNFHQGCQSRHNFASTNGTNDITTKIKTEGDFKLANQRARKNNNIDCQPISFGTSHQPISFGTFFGTYISLTNQNVQPKRNGKMSK